uniref:carbohydrate ABC transporter permease n=1 Tax=Tessaracoccus timonensis TaxID=2161816 RepID=UPI00131F1E07|nr:sugar ABC transporter permease [Tessaracoccus timonensis]
MKDEIHATGRKRTSWWRSSAALFGYVFVAPYAVLFLVFRIIPAIYGALLSFAEVNLAGRVKLVGLANFERLLSDPIFMKSLRVTLVYTIITVPMVICFSILMALLINRSLRGISIYRAVFFLPVVTSPVISGVVFKWLFGSDGPMVSVSSLLGLSTGSWLGSSTLVLPALALVQTWTRFGFDMLILLAAMLAIPQEYYEAAMVDRAGVWQRFRHVTLPLLRPALFFVLVLETVGSFQVLDSVLVMTGGGPVRGSYTLSFMIYDQAFNYTEFGYGSAVGVVVLVIILVLTVIQNKVLGRAE